MAHDVSCICSRRDVSHLIRVFIVEHGRLPDEGCDNGIIIECSGQIIMSMS